MSVFEAFFLLLLASVAFIDWRTKRIPDRLNLVIVCAACGAMWSGAIDPLPGLLSGGLFSSLLWCVRELHTRIRGRVGLGLGDVKLVGAAGMWIKPEDIPLVLSLATASALVIVGGVALLKGRSAIDQRFPFGPHLAIGFAIAHLWGG